MLCYCHSKNINMDKVKYDKLYSCNSCGGENKVTKIISFMSSGLDEVNTECKECQYIDFWAYGVFQSRIDGYNECAKYTH